MKLFALFFAIRVVYALLQTTYFVPDEVWQGPEIGHLLAFGRGYATWEWWVALRSYIHPLMFAALFKALEVLHLDYNSIIILSPRVLQAAIAAVGDLAVHKLSMHLHTAPWATIFHLTNWFSIFTYSRTVVNSTEVSLVLLGVLCFMERRFVSLAVIAGFTFAMRPTSVLFFFPLCVAVAAKARPALTATCVAAGAAVVAAGAAVDAMVYGRFALPAVNFVRYNLGLGIAANYGIHSWHFFLTLGVGSYFLTALPLVFRNFRALPAPVLAGCALSVAVLSLSSHKELRFAVPVFAVLGTVINRRPRLMVLHSVLAIFFSRIQGVAPDQIMNKIRNFSDGRAQYNAIFLSCHSTPWTTHVHDRPQVELDFLECAPTQVTGKKLNESRLFERNPREWLRTNAGRIRANDVVVFDANAEIEDELRQLGFVEKERIWDGFFGDSDSNEWTFLGNKYFVLMIRDTD